MKHSLFESPSRLTLRAAQPKSIFRFASVTVALSTGVLALNPSRAETAPAGGPPAEMQEIDVTAAKQTAIDAEAISLSDTPDAEPSAGGLNTYVIGLAARDSPVYDGSKTTKITPFPYIDIHGLWHDRIFVSDLRGLGLNVLNVSAFRAGVSLNYSGGRTSSDAPRLRGLPDISAAVSSAAFITYSIKPFAFEAKVEQEFGSQPTTALSLRASYLYVPTPRWHISAGAQIVWDDRKFNEKYYGITATEAAQATTQGNLLSSYSPGSGIGTVGVTATSVYALTEHWGIVGRFAVRDIVGSAAKDSPLTDRPNGYDFALGAIYKF